MLIIRSPVQCASHFIFYLFFVVVVDDDASFSSMLFSLFSMGSQMWAICMSYANLLGQ